MGITVLLDTHVLLWALLEPEKLSRTARDLIIDRETQLVVSAATAWEIATKFRIGKLPEAGAVVANYAEHLETLSAVEVPILSAHALLAGAFEVEHKDPFDRMIAAQAIITATPVVTRDWAFQRFPCPVLW